MKPIIVDMKEMSDSTEVYESRPNPVIAGMIYLILAIFLAAGIWMYFAKIDIVVKGNGMFRGETSAFNVSSSVNGKIKNCNVRDGQYVTQGEVLLSLEVDTLDSSLEKCKSQLEDINQRIELMTAYQKSLNGDESELASLSENPYYEEFANRKELMEANIDSVGENVEGQKKEYEKNIESMEKTIAQYEEKTEKLNQAKICIKTRNNTFDISDSYYHSVVNSYLSGYDTTSLQYDNQIREYESSIEDAEEKIENLKKRGISIEGEDETQQSIADVVAELEKEKKNFEQKIEIAKTEKEKTLQNLELEQETSIEQQIASVQSSIISLQTSLTSAKAQIEALEGKDTELSGDVAIMTEKGNIAAELLTYEDKKKECENQLENLNIQSGSCEIRAGQSGYLLVNSQLQEGAYIQQGEELCQILPEKNSEYYAEVYVENGDIGKLKEGQKVKFEIAAYPSSEYGYFTGKVENISKDIRVDEKTGSAYYTVKVCCDKLVVTNKEGKTGSIQNGMACQAKIVVDEQNVFRYVLEKIDLAD